MEKKAAGECKMRLFVKLAVFLGILFSITGGFVLYSSWPLIFGETIVLETRPVDPFDVLRGQYIVINYEISTIPLLKNAVLGDSVYVVLQENENKTVEYNSTSFIIPSRGYFIKGTVRNIADDRMTLEYGIEQYFFERVIAKTPVKNLVFFEKQIVLEVLRIFLSFNKSTIFRARSSASPTLKRMPFFLSSMIFSIPPTRLAMHGFA